MSKDLFLWKRTSNHNYIFSFLKKEEFVEFIFHFLRELGFSDKEIANFDLYYPDLEEGVYYHVENSQYFIDLIMGVKEIFMIMQCSLKDRKNVEKAFLKQGVHLNS